MTAQLGWFGDWAHSAKIGQPSSVSTGTILYDRSLSPDLTDVSKSVSMCTDINKYSCSNIGSHMKKWRHIIQFTHGKYKNVGLSVMNYYIVCF